MYRESIDQPDEFWGKIAGELHWFKKWDQVLEWKLPNAKWFVGGKINVAYNCLDHQIDRAAATRPRSSGKASRKSPPARAAKFGGSPSPTAR